MSTQKSKNSISENESGPAMPIAIVGMAGIFPEAVNLSQYWENILNEVNCIREVPESRWNVADYFDPNPSTPDKTYCKYGGFIPDIQFDPMEFGLPPNFLEVTDVSQLLGLIVARDALADARYLKKDKAILDRTGVVLGMVGMSSKVIQPLLNRLQYPIWKKVLHSSSVPEAEIPEIIEKMKLAYVGWNENAFPGAIGNVVAGRIANRLDLGGTNCIVDAACGSSLAAVNMAVSELALGHADMMITGGVDTDNSILTYLCFSKTPAFSKGDHLRAFSADSDGMLAGEGIGMLVLKRLTDAERDDDRIYAVIRGIGTSSDGNFKSIYAPRPSGQAKALRRAYQNAGYSAQTVGMIEAHGTGTMAGDPVEFEGLREVFSEDNPQKQYIALGSVKSQIGHTKATAGAASLIKASLALYHKVLPATINVSKPNPAMGIENTPFYLNTETRPWFKRSQDTPRRAGVSSFGFGGTNFHVAVEEYQNGHYAFTRINGSPYTVLFSAESVEQLKKVCLDAKNKLTGTEAANYLNQVHQAAYEQVIPVTNARVGFLTDSVEDAYQKLDECLKLMDSNKDQARWSHPKGIFFRESGINTHSKTVALFPGQGAQYGNMGKDLSINFPSFREVFEKSDAQMTSAGKDILTKTIYPIPVFSDEERNAQQNNLTATENAQPAIGTFSMGLFKLLEAAGFKADFFAGHSFGELTALWAGGVLEDDAFMRLAIARGEAMSTPASSGKDTGSMVAVKGDIKKIKEVIKDYPEIQIANINSPSQVVLAGSTKGIQDIKPVLEKAGLTVYLLKVSAAFHTPFVGHAKEPFSAAIKKEAFKKSAGIVYSNSTAQPYPADPESITTTLSDHIMNPVRFKEEIENIYASGGTIFVEIGPKNILSNLVKETLDGKPFEVITLNSNANGDSDLQFRQAILQMRIMGFELGNADPNHKVCEEKTSTTSKVAVMLNGGLYTTEATKQKFSQALDKKHEKRQEELVHKSADLPESTAKQNATKSEPWNAQKNERADVNGNKATRMEEQATTRINRSTETLIERLQEHQSEVLKAHNQFLQNDNASNTILHEIVNREISALSGQNNNGHEPLDDLTISSIERQAENISSQHEATSSAHREYIKSQTAFTEQYAALISEIVGRSVQPQSADSEFATLLNKKLSQEANKETLQTEEPINEDSTTPVVPETASLPKGYRADELSQPFLSIVSEKTGYPVEMLELSMDMEADLGIDSIKRVEILGAMQEQYPELPSIDPEELVTLRSLEQVISAFKVDAGNGPKMEAEQTTSAPEITPSSNQVPTVPEIANSEIQSVFLEIVSEKTGYPTDMLKLSMDIEADLGIDSIKCVEILGAVQEKYPDLPAITTEALVELRTLKQVIGAFKINRSSTPKAEVVQESEAGVQTATAIDKQPGAQISSTEIQNSFLEIVSEKTGYPTDMLELTMDMEADLGIDSIKRVEILGAVQEKYPYLPPISSEELVELRSLEQIIAKFSTKDVEGKSKSVKAEGVVENQPNLLKTNSVTTYPVTIRPLPKPDQVEFNIPAESTALITDDESDRTNILAESLREKGLKVGIIHVGKNGKSQAGDDLKDVKHYHLESVNEKSVQEMMEKIITESSQIVSFVHLNPTSIGNGKDALDISEKNQESLKSVFLMARHLKVPLTNVSGETRPVFFTVTHMDGQFGMNDYKRNDPLPGGFAGLTKSLRLEWTNVFCRALDFHPDIDAITTVKKINDEFHDVDIRLTEVGYTPEGRYTVVMDGEK